MNNPYNQMNRQSNMNFINNNLIAGYQKFQKDNIPFQNNPLLNNNPHFNNMINNQQMQMMNVYNHMMKYKQAQEMKKLQKTNDVTTVFDKQIVHESVIRPLKIERSDPGKIKILYDDRQSQWENEKRTAWAQRTNQPYKNIIKDQSYNKFIGKQKIDKDELIVHRVTDSDKIGLNEEFEDLVRILEKHNNDLKVIYSTNKELEYKKKFEYNHREKYRILYDPKDYKDLKKDQLEYFKKEQRKLEKDKKSIDDIIESLMSKGYLNENDIKNIENEDKLVENDDNISDLEKQLRKELGDEYNKLEQKAIKQLNEENNNKKYKNKNNNDDITSHDIKPSKKITIKTRTINNDDNTVNKENHLHKNISSNIDELKLKYLNRQKK